MSFGQVSGRPFIVILCAILLGALLPAVALAAPSDGKPREYIVTLSVTDSDRFIAPASKSARQRIQRRSERARSATTRLERAVGFKTRHRYTRAVTGFSARMTPEQAAQVAADPTVANVRLARKVELAQEQLPFGVSRVKAYRTGGPYADVDADVAIIDTGVGPAESATWPGDVFGIPRAMGPSGSPELNIAGGVNCYDDPWTKNVNEAWEPGNPEVFDGYWGDNHWHGTHVAGTIGARDNGVGTVGVAPGARLWAVRAFQGEAGSEAAIICGLEWVASRNTDGNPNNDIEVVNMSIQGIREDFEEDCTKILARSNADPVHKGVCTVTDLGVTVVAAAGNHGFNANRSWPGGYDQVISVGAMTDFDGEGWGEAGNSGCDPSERDDTFGSYSNHGTEVDIVAPGTCVLSTYPTTSGQATATSSGTSMAAPHVTGAVARYLADHPDTTPEKMRKLVRAAGRMDWDAKTDPVWSGVSDSDEPNRVLDVKALTGPEMLKSWVYHESFKVGGDDKSRTTRVDVQRGGGYNGVANLDVSGLPSTVGTAAFDDNGLQFLAGLGTNLKLSFKTNGDEGDFEVGVRVNASGIAAFTRDLSLTVDRTGPEVDDLAARVRGGNVSFAASGATQTYLLWDVSDQLSNVKTAQLQRKIGTQSWRDAGTSGASNSRVTLKKGQDNRFRVKAIDSLGNKTYSTPIDARLSVRDSDSTQLVLPASGGWRTKAVKKAYGGSILLADGATDSISTEFTGKAVAVAGSIGPNRGTFRVRVDGGDWHDVSLKSSKAGHRRVVWSRMLEDGEHTLEIQGKSGQTALDAVHIIR